MNLKPGKRRPQVEQVGGGGKMKKQKYNTNERAR